LFRVLAFAQLSWRQLLRDIEACVLQPEIYNSSNIEADNQLLLFDF